MLAIVFYTTTTKSVRRGQFFLFSMFFFCSSSCLLWSCSIFSHISFSASCMPSFHLLRHHPSHLPSTFLYYIVRPHQQKYSDFFSCFVFAALPLVHFVIRFDLGHPYIYTCVSRSLLHKQTNERKTERKGKLWREMKALLLKCLALWGVVKGSLLNIHMHLDAKESNFCMAVYWYMYVFNKMVFIVLQHVHHFFIRLLLLREYDWIHLTAWG